MPNVVGMTQAAATSSITASGLTLGTVTSASSETVPAGSVISQSPVGGFFVNPGSSVSLVVSTGPSGVPSVILASIYRPTAGTLVPDEVLIEVSVKSTYEVTSVIASMAGRQVALAIPPDWGN